MKDKLNSDFDLEIQKIFNNILTDLRAYKWKDWLKIKTKEEYEEFALKLSGLNSIEDIYERIKKEKSNSVNLSVDLYSYVVSSLGSDILIMCHTSGTTNSNLSRLKWFHMSKSLIQRLWAPGMRAIFESSGLNSKNSAIIFVPSRINFDGIRLIEGKKYISLYSSEFSQRVVISTIKPYSYLLYQYKHSCNLDIIAKILSMEKISVISAPALTIIKWADPVKFKRGLKDSIKEISKGSNPKKETLLKIINKEGLNDGSKIIQKLLSDKLSKATIIFSISSLNQNQWSLIRHFMKWKQGQERFTNLYVASEIGPFASSISEDDYKIAQLNKMYIFPLTLPVIENSGKFELVSRSNFKLGKLYISRFDNGKPLINIDIGDVIKIEKQEGLPLISGKILRAGFRLKYPIKFSKKTEIPSKYIILAGDYFTFKEFNIIEPRNLLNCLNTNCESEIDSILLIKSEKKENIPWKLVLYFNGNSNCTKKIKVYTIIQKCLKEKAMGKAINNNSLRIQLMDEQPIDFMKTREFILKKVHKGFMPKGILKKWPLYIVLPSSYLDEIFI
ncbi:MAG: hypothetical protein ACFFAN_05325 [Promethearchaeota archaeon]